MTARKTKTYGEVGPIKYRIKHALVWTSREDRPSHWITLDQEVLLSTDDWDKAVRKVRPKIGSHYSISALIEDGKDRAAARKFIVGG